jgi:hypothetical protein
VSQLTLRGFEGKNNSISADSKVSMAQTVDLFNRIEQEKI